MILVLGGLQAEENEIAADLKPTLHPTPSTINPNMNLVLGGLQAEEYEIAADLAKQAAEAGNLADAAQDEVISHLVLAQRLAREAEGLRERGAELGIAAQSLDQLVGSCLQPLNPTP